MVHIGSTQTFKSQFFLFIVYNIHVNYVIPSMHKQIPHNFMWAFQVLLFYVVAEEFILLDSYTSVCFS